MNNLKKCHIAGIIFSIIAGSLLHFVYGLSGNNPIVAIFTPVNESTREHLKLLFYPLLLSSFVEFFIYGKEYKNFFPVRFFSGAIGMIAIVASFYTYTGIIGKII